jgi:glutathione S-transferase
MITVWGRNNSINVQKVMWLIAELDLPHTRIDAGGRFGLTTEPAYLALNPNSTVPTIRDGNLVIWESNTILRYLAATYSAGELWPLDAQHRSHAERWMDWQLSVLAPAITPLFWQLIRTPEEKRDVSVMDTAARKCGTAFSILDAHLAARPYLAGDDLTVGDFALGCAVSRWMAMPIERPELPNLARYYGLLSGRAPFVKHVCGIPLT